MDPQAPPRAVLGSEVGPPSSVSCGMQVSSRWFKLFITLFTLGGVVWFGTSITRMVVGFDVFVPGTLELKTTHSEEVLGYGSDTALPVSDAWLSDDGHDPLRPPDPCPSVRCMARLYAMDAVRPYVGDAPCTTSRDPARVPVPLHNNGCERDDWDVDAGCADNPACDHTPSTGSIFCFERTLMKADKLFDELLALAKSLGYSVRRESGTFRGGACVVHEQRVILINRSMPIEAAAVILARALARFVPEDQFMKPAVRDIIDREQAYLAAHPDVTFAPQQQPEEAA